MGITNIISGHVNEALGFNQDLYEKRIAICKKCPLYTKHKIIGEYCSPQLYLNPETNDISFKYKHGYKHGCGCRLDAKTRLKNEKCPVGKWTKETYNKK